MCKRGVLLGMAFYSPKYKHRDVFDLHLYRPLILIKEKILHRQSTNI